MTTLLQPGERCADYEILHHLATGDHAEVYAVVGPVGEPRALKLVATDEGLTATVYARLAQEGEALTLIVHPGVVRFYAAGIWQDRVWLTLELVLGDTLRECLEAAPGRVPLDLVLYWMQQACDGIAEAHRVGVVHRDLTPDNILVSAEDVVKVVDFGLAKLRGHGVKTSHEQAIGSAWYMAPEQARGAPAHPSMDVYAIAVVLYEAITGVHPMGNRARTMIDIVAWHLSAEPPMLRALAPGAPSDLEALIHQGLAKDPARRPTMRAFTDGLRDALCRLRAPQRREARNIPLPNRGIGLAPTAPMPIHDDPVTTTEPPVLAALAPLAPRGTLPMAPAPGSQGAPVTPITLRAPAPEPTAPATDRSRAASSAMTQVATAPDRAAMLPVAVADRASAPAGLRSTDVPVETTVRRSTASPRRAPVAGLAVGAVTIAAAATGWMLFGRVSHPAWVTASASSAPPPGVSAVPAVSAVPPAPTPTVSPSASAAPGLVTPPRPAGVGAPARPPPRRAPAARTPVAPPPAAKNRLFGTEK